MFKVYCCYNGKVFSEETFDTWEEADQYGWEMCHEYPNSKGWDIEEA